MVLTWKFFLFIYLMNERRRHKRKLEKDNEHYKVGS